jgi:lipopolysaccharide/colanic/teichoic acid biosynthesis glycosyltransferase
MSLVGPRPEMPFIVESYDDLQKLRLSVKPGLTGVWQISADRANPIHENIDYDLYYLENQSFWLDLAILMKTFTSVVKGVGAY